MRILEMIESGKISADEGASLLDTFKGREADRAVKSTARERRWFKVRVTDTVTGRNKALVSIPFGLMDWGLKVGAKFAPELSDVDMGELREVLHSDLEGKIIDVLDEEDGEHVEIYVE
jgi:hypothetical protein